MSVPERVRDLQAVVMEHLVEEPVTPLLAAIVCDRCGAVTHLDPVEPDPAATDRWGKGPEGDLCPTCVDEG